MILSKKCITKNKDKEKIRTKKFTLSTMTNNFHHA